MEGKSNGAPSIGEILGRVDVFFPPSTAEPDMKLEADDVVVAAGPKAGSTWVQQILHGLRSGGKMDYEDINAAVPVLEFKGTSGGTEYDNRNGSTEELTQQPYALTLYKTHLRAEKCPKGAGKIVVVTRDPDDAAWSLYHFLCNWIFKADEMSVDDFIEWFYVQPYKNDVMFLNAHQMKHLASWYPYRKDKNVLWLHYEDLKADLSKCVRMISEFVGVGVDDQKLLDLVEHQASFDFMKQHAAKFDSRNYKLARNEAAGLPREAGLISSNYAGKVRNGKVNESKEALSAKNLKTLKKLWDDIIKPVTGFDTYEEMRASVNKELGRTFKQ